VNFFNKTVVLGVTGGIAAYKACEIVSALKQLGADMHVVMTKAAKEFIAPLTFETLSGNRVVCGMFERNFEHNVRHVSLAQKTDIFIVAPATANFIAKYTHGIADDFLSTAILACNAPILLAPAMNTNMLEHDTTQTNIRTLKKRGVHFIESEVGMLACGVKGAGRLAKPSVIVAKAHSILFANQDYAGKTVLVTAGATKTHIDPVRYITNHSSGKMGLAIAEAAMNRGACVILVHANLLHEPKFMPHKSIKVDTTQEMCDRVLENLPEADFIIKAGAPADYVVEPESQKLKEGNIALPLKRGVDIAYEVGKIKGNKKLIIFAAETQDLIKNAKAKLKRKNADMVVANNVAIEGAGFWGDTNIATILTRTRQAVHDKMLKSTLADIVLDAAREL